MIGSGDYRELMQSVLSERKKERDGHLELVALSPHHHYHPLLSHELVLFFIYLLFFIFFLGLSIINLQKVAAAAASCPNEKIKVFFFLVI